MNDWLLAENIRHSLALQGYSNATVNKVMAVLNRSDARLYQELADALENVNASSFSIERLESLLGSVRAVNAAAYTAMGLELTTSLADFAAYEVAYQAQMLRSVLPAVVHVASVSVQSAVAAANAKPFQGVLLREVLQDLSASRAKKIRQTVAQGFVEGKTTDAIVRQLRGTRAAGYADGLLNGSRREVEAITRTALSHTAGVVQDKTAEANEDLIKAVKWLSVTDLRTTKNICIPRDGKLYETVTHKPIGHQLPWLGGPGRAHWNCRSAQCWVLKSNAELGIPGVPEVVVIGKTRASLDGQIPADVNYLDWANQQSAARQDEIFGPRRGQLLRQGGLKAEELYSTKGQLLTLEELRKRDSKAFEKAGL